MCRLIFIIILKLTVTTDFKNDAPKQNNSFGLSDKDIF